MLPKYRAIELPLIKEIFKRGGRTEPQPLYKSLAEFFELTKEDLDQETEDKRSKWENQVQWAIKKLKDLGVISNSEHGVWVLTEKGTKAAEFIKDYNLTPEVLAELTEKSLISTLKEVFERMKSSAFDPKKALEIVKPTDCKSLLEILGL